MPNWTKRRTLAAIGVTALIVAAAGAVAYFTLRPAPQARAYPPARTRTTINFTACLVESTAGTGTTPQSQSAWQGLLDAQKSTDIRVQTFNAPGAETAANAQIAVNTLALRGCNLVAAATPLEDEVVERQAHLYVNTEFAVVTSAKPQVAKPANLTIEPAGTDSRITSEITELVLSAVARHN